MAEINILKTIHHRGTEGTEKTFYLLVAPTAHNYKNLCALCASVVKKLLTFFSKKNPAKRPGNKGGTGLGMPVPMARKRRERAYAGLQRIHKKALITIKTNQ